MKKIYYIGTLIVCAIAGLALLKGVLKKDGSLHFVEEQLQEKNFGAFPIDIPEEQFENWLFV